MSLQKNLSATKRYQKVVKFAGWLQNIPNKITPATFRLMQIGSAFWQSRALHAAAHFDIASVLADEPLSATQLAQRIATQPDATYRLLRLLAAMGIFQETAPAVFSNNALSNYLRRDHPQNVRAMILLHNSATMSKPWYEQLEQSMAQGKVPFEQSHACSLFDYMDQHAEFDALFSAAMDSVAALTGDSFARDFDWGQFKRIIDIGGSRGSKAVSILQQHPSLQALIFDRPQVIAEAQTYWRNHNDRSLQTRLSFQAGNLLEAVPTAQNSQDIYLLSAVLHGFDDTRCIQILHNLARACQASGARIALMELVLAPSNADLTSATFDMQMFIATHGRERTLEQWCALFSQAGLQLEEVVNLQSFAKILVLR